MTVDITHLLGRRYRPPTPPAELARLALDVIAGSAQVRTGGFMWELGDPVGNVRRCVPGAWAAFGEATVTAAAAKMPGGGCRWCVARSLATVHRLPAPVDTPAVRTLLGRPCAKHRRRATNITAQMTAITAGARRNDFRNQSRFPPGTYLATLRGGQLNVGNRVTAQEPNQHYVELDYLGTYLLRHPAGCAFNACPFEPGAIAAAQAAAEAAHSQRRPEVSLAFTASATANLAARVRGGPPTPVQPLTASARNVEAMRRVGVNPESYFGVNFTTQEQDAALGALIRRTYPGRQRKR
jgi:hypothetical protein